MDHGAEVRQLWRTSQKHDWEELPHVRSQGQQPGGTTPRLRPGAVARRSYLMPEVNGGGQEEQSHIQEAMAALAQEGQEELLHVQGQEGWWWGDNPHPR